MKTIIKIIAEHLLRIGFTSRYLIFSRAIIGICSLSLLLFTAYSFFAGGHLYFQAALLLFLSVNMIILIFIIKVLSIVKTLEGDDALNRSDTNLKRPGWMSVAIACFAIFFIFYLAVHFVLDILGVSLNEFSLTYSLLMLVGYVLTCVIFTPICFRYMK